MISLCFRTTMKRSALLIVVCFALVEVVGCGSSDPAVNSEDQPTATDSSEKSDSQPTVPDTKTSDADNSTGQRVRQPSAGTRRPNERWTDADGVEYLGNVPLDVFFDQPLEVASNGTPLKTGAVVGSPVADPLGVSQSDASMGTGSKAGMDTEGSKPANVAGMSKADDWAALLPAKNLLDEVNQIRNFMNSSLQSVGTYNNSMLSIPGKAAALAALAHIASEHSEQISWKEDAVYIRNLAKKMTETTLQRGKKDQGRLLLLFENIADILNRSRPAGLEEPSPDDSFSDVAEMGFLMARMADAERRMKNEAGNESGFASRKEMVRHEAMIMASLTKVIAKEEYGYGDDPEFVGYAQKVIEACDTIRDSADTGTFSAYDLALSRISTNCQECHSLYKNN